MFSWFRRKDGLSAAIAQQQAENAATREKMNDLTAKVVNLTESLTKLEEFDPEEIRALREENEALKAENAQLKQRLGIA